MIDVLIDIGKYTPANMKSAPFNQGLIIVFQTLVGKWGKILGVFATSINSGDLSKLIIQAVVLCENSGLFIDFLTCDAAQSNRSMCKQ